MSKIEYFLLVPAIIYGVAIVDLLKIFQNKKRYWETILWGVILLEMIILNWVELFNKLDQFVDNNINFTLLIIQSILFAQMAAVLTPENSDKDSEQYFAKSRKLFFTLGAGVVLINLAAQYLVFDDHRVWLRLSYLPMFIACYIMDKKWIRSIVAIFFLLVGATFLFF